MQVLTPSPLGKATPGMHRVEGGGKRHSAKVQVASRFTPLRGHVHVLQPSSAGNSTSGQHRSSGRGAWGAWGAWGGVGHANLVQKDALQTPLHGHMHVFRPSPAG